MVIVVVTTVGRGDGIEVTALMQTSLVSILQLQCCVADPVAVQFRSEGCLDFGSRATDADVHGGAVADAIQAADVNVMDLVNPFNTKQMLRQAGNVVALGGLFQK